jgi:hypothetical protein
VKLSLVQPLKKFRVTIGNICVAFTRRMKGSNVLGYEQASSLLFQYCVYSVNNGNILMRICRLVDYI